MGAAILEALGSSGLETGLHLSHPGLAVSLPHLLNHSLCVPIFYLPKCRCSCSSHLLYPDRCEPFLPSPASVMFMEFYEHGSHLPSCTRSPKGLYFAEGCRELCVTPDEGVSSPYGRRVRFRETKGADAGQAEGATQTTARMALGSHGLGGHLTVWTNLEEPWRALGNSQAGEGFTFWKDDQEGKRNPRGRVSGRQGTQPPQAPKERLEACVWSCRAYEACRG